MKITHECCVYSAIITLRAQRDGAKVLDLFQAHEHNYELVILDVDMPILNGADTSKPYPT